MATEAGLIEKLGQPGHFTLFAPTNDAFEKLDREVMDRLMKDKVSLQGKPKHKNVKHPMTSHCTVLKWSALSCQRDMLNPILMADLV